MPDPGQYTYDATLRDADDMVVRHIPNNPTLLHRVHKKAHRDVRLKLRGHGYLDAQRITPHAYNPAQRVHLQAQQAAELANAFVVAEATVSFTALTTGSLTVPAGTRIIDQDPDDANETTVGARGYTTDEELVVLAGATGSVAVTAENAGAAYNLPAGVPLYLEDGAAALSHFSACASVAMTTDGVDHQMTRAATYRALCLLYLELTRQPDDAFDRKMQTYSREYEAEIAALVAGGLVLEIGTEDGETSIEEADLAHGFHRLQRG